MIECLNTPTSVRVCELRYSPPPTILILVPLLHTHIVIHDDVYVMGEKSIDVTIPRWYSGEVGGCALLPSGCSLPRSW